MRDSIANLRVRDGKPGGLFFRRQFTWNNIQQDARDLSVGQVRGDPGPHGPRAQDANLPDLMQMSPPRMISNGCFGIMWEQVRPGQVSQFIDRTSTGNCLPRRYSSQGNDPGVEASIGFIGMVWTRHFILALRSANTNRTRKGSPRVGALRPALQIESWAVGLYRS